MAPLAQVVDSALVGNLNTVWLGALAVSMSIYSSVVWPFNFIVHLTTQKISREYSQTHSVNLLQKIFAILLFTLILGTLFSVTFYLFRYQFYSLATSRSELFEFADLYFVPIILGLPVTLLSMAILSVLRGMEKVNVSFFIVALITILNIVFSWSSLHLFGKGLDFVAISTILSQGVGSLLAILFLVSEDWQSFLEFVKSKNEISSWWGIVKGELASWGRDSRNLIVRSAVLSLTFFLCTRVASGLGTKELAAYQVLLQIWLFFSYWIDGLAITGNIYGAKFTSEGAQEADHQTFRLMWSRLSYWGLFMGIVFILIGVTVPEQVMSIFTNDMMVKKLITPLLPWVLLSFPVCSIAYVLDGVMFGQGQFHYLKTHIMIGFIIGFLPFLIYADKYQIFWPIWIGMITMTAYRALTNFYKLNEKSLTTV
jgi:multidrug resistance protein, MATE family